MKSRIVLAAFAAAVVMVGVVLAASACPQKLCVCDCDAKCRCGEDCKKVKECKIVKKCWNKKPCSNEKKVAQCDAKAKKQLVCHIPPGNPSNAHTLCVDQSAVPAHLAHGDYLGQCLSCDDVCTYKKCCKWVTKCACRPCPGEGCPPCECPPPSLDAAVSTPDAFVPTLPDAAMVEPDIAVVDPDAAVVEPDIAVVDPDAAVVKPDTAVVESDAGVYVPEDAGVTLSPDAGPAADLEIIESDGPCNCPDGYIEEKRPMELLGSGCQMGGPLVGSPWGGILIIGLLGTALFLLRRSKAVLGALLAIGLMSASAKAEPNLPASHFQPSGGADDYYQTVSPSTLGHGKISLGAFYNYEHRPLQILWEDTGDRVTSVVRYRHNLDLLFAIGLGSRLEFGMGVPFVLGQGTHGLQFLNGPSGDSFDGGIGDLRVSAKLRALEAGPFALGLGASLVTPTASDASAFGQGGFVFAPALLMELSSKYISGAVNAGVSVAGSDELRFEDQSVMSGSSFFGSFALKVPVWRGKLDLIGDAFMSMNLKEQDKEEIPFEILGGLRAHLGHGVTFDAGAGPGMTKGVGTPAFRVFAGLSWSPQPEKVRVKVVEKGCEECDKPVITQKVNIVVAKTKLVLKLPQLFPVFFATDKDEPLPQSLLVLEKNLSILKEYKGITKVVISGNCDWRASNAYNLDLGMRRAANVKKWFVDRGVDEKRLVVVSYGEAKPKVSNKTKAGMSQNRRVGMDIVEPKNGVMLQTFRQIHIIKQR